MHVPPVRTQTAGHFGFTGTFPCVFLVSFLIRRSGDDRVWGGVGWGWGVNVSEAGTLPLLLKDVTPGLRGRRCRGAHGTKTVPAARGQRETLRDDCSEADSPGLRKPFQ